MGGRKESTKNFVIGESNDGGRKWLPTGAASIFVVIMMYSYKRIGRREKKVGVARVRV